MSLGAQSPSAIGPRARRAVSVLVIALAMIVGASVPAHAAPARRCGDAPANYPRAGVYNVTAQVTRCYVARGIAVRWYFRNQHSPAGYRCRVRRTPALGGIVRCTHRGGRVVRFEYYLSPNARVPRSADRAPG